MPDWFRYTVIAFGVLFFVAHVALMLLSLPYARTRDDRLEFIGKCVPGLGGLSIAVSVIVSSPTVGILLSLLGLPIMLLGRAVYELVVFRSR